MQQDDETTTDQRRREAVLRSLCLTSVAAEIDQSRLRELRRTLAGPLTRAEQRQYRRVLALNREGRLDELPRDMRANAARMQRTLIALCRLLRLPGSTAGVTVGAIAEEMGATESTARRGVLDLEAGYLIAVERRDRARWQGGQGANGYRLVWSTLRDLALTQGLQAQLFDAEGFHHPVTATEGGRPDELSGRGASNDPTSVTVECGRPGELSGRESGGLRDGAPSHSDGAPSHSDGAPSHSDGAPSHSDGAPSHSDGARACARGRSLSPDLLLREDLRSSSSVFSGSQEEEKEKTGFSDWEEIQRRLWAMKIDAARQATVTAARNGWTARQAAELLDACERERIGEHLPWSPGAVWWQLVNGKPGSRISMQRQEAWTRARRDADLAARRRKAEQGRELQQQRTEQIGSQRAELEAAAGELLDSLDAEQLEQLIDRTIAPNLAGKCRQWLAAGEGFGPFRLPLLEALSEQLNHAETGGLPHSALAGGAQGGIPAGGEVRR